MTSIPGTGGPTAWAVRSLRPTQVDRDEPDAGTTPPFLIASIVQMSRTLSGRGGPRDGFEESSVSRA